MSGITNQSFKSDSTSESPMIRNFFTTTVVSLSLLLATSIATVAANEGGANSPQKAVLVTGSSSGIGLKITQVLAAEGHFVFAGARKQKDLDALNAMENVQAVRLDVTVQADIDAAVETVRSSGKGLYGLVNNAGVYVGGPLIEVDEDELEWLFDVNVFGVYRVTQAFAPMIIEQKGRISTIGSIAGTGSSPLGGIYQMSKHAIEAYTDSLAMEMERFEVGVSVIEPGNYKSAISQSAANRMAEKGYAREGSPYADDIKARLKRPTDRSQYKEPDEVAEAALHALFDETPRRRYMVVPDEGEADWTISKAIEEVVQLNDWQAYSYSRDELVEKLDAAIATNK
jgi:NAD(P)-dependent dehydrogenase (short-subunit alcohol dehydrogenase family)